MEETKQPSERKLISFANPQVKYALDDQKNASALVEALVAKQLNVQFDETNPAHAERVELTKQIEDDTAPAPDAPATAAALLDNEVLPENAPSGIQEEPDQPSVPEDQSPAEDAKAEEDFLNTPLPDVPAEDFLPAKPQPLSNDFADLSENHSPVGVSDEVKAELNPEPAAETPVPPEAVPSNPGFVPEAKPEPKILPITNLDEPVPAEEVPTYAAGSRVCPTCAREILLDTCLNCGSELK